MLNLLRLGNKNKRVCFVFLSTFSNFAHNLIKQVNYGILE